MTSPKRNTMGVGFNSAVPSSDSVECVHLWMWYTAGHPWAKCRKCGATKTMPGPGNSIEKVEETMSTPRGQLDIARRNLRVAQEENAKLRRENESLRASNKALLETTHSLENRMQQARNALGPNPNEAAWKDPDPSDRIRFK